MVIDIYALDLDPEKILLLNSVLDDYIFEDGKAGKEKITPVEGDIFDLPDFDEPFDGVLVKDVIGLVTSRCRKEISYFDKFKETTKEVMKEIKKIISQNSWLTIRDRDIDKGPGEYFMEGMLSVLDPHSVDTGYHTREYGYVPVEGMGDEDEEIVKIFAIDRKINSFSSEKNKENIDS